MLRPYLRYLPDWQSAEPALRLGRVEERREGDLLVVPKQPRTSLEAGSTTEVHTLLPDSLAVLYKHCYLGKSLGVLVQIQILI